MSEFEKWSKSQIIMVKSEAKSAFEAGQQSQQASAQRESYKLVPCNPTEEMWGGTARQLVKYMQMKDRYCPASLKKHFDRFIGEIPDWLNEEVQDWTSEHAFATADLGVFIYKAMYHEFKN